MTLQLYSNGKLTQIYLSYFPAYFFILPAVIPVLFFLSLALPCSSYEGHRLSFM